MTAQKDIKIGKNKYLHSLLRCLVVSTILLFFLESYMFDFHFWSTLSLWDWLYRIGLIFLIAIAASGLTYLSTSWHLWSLFRCLVVALIGLFFLESYMFGIHFWKTLSFWGLVHQIGLAFLIALTASILANSSRKKRTLK